MPRMKAFETKFRSVGSDASSSDIASSTTTITNKITELGDNMDSAITELSRIRQANELILGQDILAEETD